MIVMVSDVHSCRKTIVDFDDVVWLLTLTDASRRICNPTFYETAAPFPLIWE